MTLRRNKIEKKKAAHLNYSLAITNTFYKPDYKSVKSKLHENEMPGDVEKKLHQQLQYMKDQAQLADTPFISSLRTA